MRAAILREFGLPQFGTFPDPSEPDGQGRAIVHVRAAGVSHADLLKASGRHYSGVPPLPSVPGTDGVGFLGDTRVYFDHTIAPYGAMAEFAVIEPRSAVPVPDGLDNATAAALGNAGVTSYLSLVVSGGLVSGETVLILGATGAVGATAVQVARLAGAGTVIAAGRDEKGLARALTLGADVTVRLNGDEEKMKRQLAAAGPVDLTIDLLWGAPARAALAVAAPGLRHVQVGHAAGEVIELGAMTLRRGPISVVGHANFQIEPGVRAEAYRFVSGHAARGELEIDVESVALEDAARAWERLRTGATGHKKFVLIP